MKEALEAALREILGPGEVVALRRLPGGASKEAWAVDYRTGEALHPLFLRRAGGGVIYSKTLALAEEFRLLQVAWAHGVKVPEPLH